VRLYMADAVDVSANGLAIFGINELEVQSCPAPTDDATAPTKVQYQGSVTPRVRSVVPNRGSTAGGTAVVVRIDGLDSVAKPPLAVSIVGIPCQVSATDYATGEVSCVTGSHGTTNLARPGIGAVVVTVDGIGSAAAAAEATFEYVDLWSRRSTWGGGTVPGVETRGDSVWIQSGQRILLDTSIDVYMLIVQGNLTFDRTDLNVDANYIFVMGGSLTVGTEADPFLQKAVITLRGSPVSKEIPVYGAKSLACRFCTLDLHGRPLLDGRTHTKLALTAAAGATEIWLNEPVDWDVGSKIMITSTAADGSPSLTCWSSSSSCAAASRPTPPPPPPPPPL